MRLNELFESIQGEGPDAGRRAIFVRLGGCNRRCDWCDTKYAWKTWVEVSVDEIVKAIVRHVGIKYVVITGGEPMIQEADVYELSERLRERGYEVVLETNGDFQIDVTKFDRVIVSPKDIATLRKWLGNKNVVLKVVVDEQNADEVMDVCRKGVYFMPKGDTPEQVIYNSWVIIQKMQEHQVDGYLCSRLHILLGLR